MKLLLAFLILSISVNAQEFKTKTRIKGDTTFVTHLRATETFFTNPPMYAGYVIEKIDTIIKVKEDIGEGKSVKMEVEIQHLEHYKRPYGNLINLEQSKEDTLFVPVGKYKFIKIGDKVYRITQSIEEVPSKVYNKPDITYY